MKKLIVNILFVFLSASVGAIGQTINEGQKIYQEANTAYQKLQFEKSIQLYEKLLKEDFHSSDVFYNLGNAYFKNGNFAKAILNYERALKSNPDDEDVIFNLKIASLKVADKIENVPEIFYKKWINKLSLIFSSASWATILIILSWLLFGSAAFYIVGQSIATKKIAFISMLGLILLTSGTAIIAYRSHAINYVDQKAIIMATSVYIKSSPDEKGNDLFILHEGTKVDLLDQLNNWHKIRIANGSVGWMKSEDIEKI